MVDFDAINFIPKFCHNFYPTTIGPPQVSDFFLLISLQGHFFLGNNSPL